MGWSREAGRDEPRREWSIGPSSARSAPIYARTARGSRPLLLPHLLKRQSCANGDYIQDGMRRVRGQTQRVNSFPRSNADLRRIEVGALLGQLLASLFGALKFFLSKAFGWSPYQVTGAGRRHVSSVPAQ
jgi:hypothetical protein